MLLLVEYQSNASQKVWVYSYQNSPTNLVPEVLQVLALMDLKCYHLRRKSCLQCCPHQTQQSDIEEGNIIRLKFLDFRPMHARCHLVPLLYLHGNGEYFLFLKTLSSIVCLLGISHCIRLYSGRNCRVEKI